MFSNRKKLNLLFKRPSGFTLIELLVVVLIIGILAAIALPMYNASVEKSRAAEALSIGKVLRGAADRYYLINGTYPSDSDMDALDISFPWESTGIYYYCPRQSCYNLKYFSYEIDQSQKSITVRRNMTTASSPQSQSYYFMFYENGLAICFARTEAAKKACIAAGGKNETQSGSSWLYNL
jgi:prepilin-type N-terminal cleavage/methylation domain-containing protein